MLAVLAVERRARGDVGGAMMSVRQVGCSRPLPRPITLVGANLDASFSEDVDSVARMLIIDENPLIRLLVRAMLARAACDPQPTEARLGGEALPDAYGLAVPARRLCTTCRSGMVIPMCGRRPDRRGAPIESLGIGTMTAERPRSRVNRSSVSDPNRRLTAAVQRIGELPVLDRTVQRVLALCRDLDSSTSELTAVLESDPDFAANLLRFANSAHASRPVRYARFGRP